MYIHSTNNKSRCTAIVNSPVKDWHSEIDHESVTLDMKTNLSGETDRIVMLIMDVEQAEWLIAKLEAFLMTKQASLGKV